MGCWRNQKESIKIHQNKWQLKHSFPKSVGYSKSSSKRDIYSNIIEYLKKQQKFQINNITYYLDELEKEDQTKPQISRRKEKKI